MHNIIKAILLENGGLNKSNNQRQMQKNVAFTFIKDRTQQIELCAIQ